MSEQNDNMKLWNQVCTTDPAITKKVNQRGGFTAIDAQAQIKRATELWGPYGGKWGVKHCNYHHIYNTYGADAGIAEVTLDGNFYYPDGEFQIATDMKYKSGNDSYKKLLTDLTTKALSKLGFNSDVFEGKFDDNKYVEKLKNGNGKPASLVDIEGIQRLMDEIEDLDEAKFADYLKQTCSVTDVKELKASDVAKVYSALNTKLDKQNAQNN